MNPTTTGTRPAPRPIAVWTVRQGRPHLRWVLAERPRPTTTQAAAPVRAAA